MASRWPVRGAWSTLVVRVVLLASGAGGGRWLGEVVLVSMSMSLTRQWHGGTTVLMWSLVL